MIDHMRDEDGYWVWQCTTCREWSPLPWATFSMSLWHLRTVPHVCHVADVEQHDEGCVSLDAEGVPLDAFYDPVEAHTIL